MKIRYDGEGDTLDILLKEAGIHHAEEYGQIIINYTKDNQPVEIEILNASKFFGEFLTGIMRAKPKAKLIEVGS
ncbi:MAG: hypothetical protein COT45_02680 [bacterium (Candidatus Stahlbacteria) CG08_land_8_20_14_0_20_40_26]|nr:MAG: hypothetical protein COX49_07280 [bacterium (Candidatus Stahlbacteria) CG23_combo_of_CG06-09_8_20_14_all_40_9]PIS25373.1 MAG: hypothetical protein COT45_02680 [bacterium (Candidatus Stahlbacteria) CG08_land_8_20_14_0_20_40_26]